MIVIVNYSADAGKALSNVLTNMAVGHVLSDTVEAINQSDYIILPNADNYSEVMAELKAKGLIAAIKAQVLAGKPLLGIGLGLHLLFEGETTTGFTAGLGLLEGLSEELPRDEHYPLPHQESGELMGLAENTSVTAELAEQTVAYDHRLTVDCELEIIKAIGQYSIKFPAIIQEKNIVGYQFLPEYSGRAGEQALTNFIKNDES